MIVYVEALLEVGHCIGSKIQSIKIKKSNSLRILYLKAFYKNKIDSKEI